ncbi:MAG: hypothetical protein AAGF89_00665 [Bacteroidota bacterium]
MKNLFLLCLSLIYCQLGVAQNDYYPLVPGTTFEMEFGEVYAQMGSSHGRMAITEQTKTIDNKSYTIIESLYGDGTNFSSAMTLYVRTDAEGNIWMASSIDEKESLAFPTANKLTKGYRWTTTTAGIATENLVVDTNGTFKCPNGKTFNNCLIVEQIQDGIPIVRSYAQKNVGPVATCVIEDGQEIIMQYLTNKF